MGEASRASHAHRELIENGEVPCGFKSDALGRLDRSNGPSIERGVPKKSRTVREAQDVSVEV